jgi:hypothetical protein
MLSVSGKNNGQVSTRPKFTAAGKLLDAVSTTGAIDLPLLARRMGTSAHRLQACRDGMLALEPELQIVLAALVMEISPDHATRARRLHAQAQSALRVREGSVESHTVYSGRRY